MSSKTTTRWVVALTGVGSLMAALDTLVVSTALSRIRLDLGASIEQLEWTVNAYNPATFITVAPIAGARRPHRRAPVDGRRAHAAGGGDEWLALIAEPGLPYSELLAPFIVAGVGVSMAIPSAQNSVVGSIASDAIGKAAGANSMMRELGGVFGVAIVVAVFAATGGYTSAAVFTDGFGPAIAVAAALAFIGAVAGLALPKNEKETTQCDKSWSATRSSLSASPTMSASCAPSTTS